MIQRWPHTPQWIRRLAIVLAFALTAGMILGPLVGCAEAQKKAPPKAECPIATVAVVRDRDGTLYFVLDMAAMETIGERLRGVQDGTCQPGEIWARDARLM